MVGVGDKVRVTLSDVDVEALGPWLTNPSGMEGVVKFIDGDDEYPIAVEFEKEDPEDTRQFPDFFAEDELEVLPDGN